mmetsp:Transcript_23917/g.36363  ORF Transcript_23917/g.36363 Transcript_23917/m.36363 type:complete len:217 (-) Transcript_23917:23-673(-)
MSLVHPRINCTQKALVQICLIQLLHSTPHRIHPLLTQRNQELPAIRFTRRLHHPLHILRPLIQAILRHAHHRLNRIHQIIRKRGQFFLLELILRLIGALCNSEEELRGGDHADGAGDGVGEFVRFGVAEFRDHVVDDGDVRGGGLALVSFEAGFARGGGVIRLVGEVEGCRVVDGDGPARWGLHGCRGEAETCRQGGYEEYESHCFLFGSSDNGRC